MTASKQEYRDWRDFKAMHRGEEGARAGFERACEILLRKMYAGRNVRGVRPSPGDEGIDVFLGELGIAPILVFQCKFFLEGVGESQRQQIRASFRRAVESSKYTLAKWTLCIPTRLTIDAHSWWAKWSRKEAHAHGVEIALLDGNALLDLMKSHGVYNRIFNIPEIKPGDELVPTAGRAALRTALAERYADVFHSQIMPFFADSAPMPIEDCYVNLAIVHQRTQRNRELKLAEPPEAFVHQPIQTDREPKLPGPPEAFAATGEGMQEGLLQAWDTVHMPDETVDLDDILEIAQDSRRARRILVLGCAGVGKTTLCRRIASQWAKRKLRSGQFQYLFLIPLRNLTQDNYPLSESPRLVDLLLGECLATSQRPEARQTLRMVLNRYPERVLLVLDGYDETANIPAHLQQILADELLNHPNVILTSRPHPGLPVFDVRLEAIGFTHANIEAYISMYFEQRERPAKAEALLAFVKANPRIKGSAHIPINLELICGIWDSKVLPAPLNLTELYAEMCALLYRRYLKERAGLPDADDMTDKRVRGSCGRLIAAAQELAYVGMKEGQVILGGDQVERVLDASEGAVQIADILALGLLKPTRDSSLRTRNDYYYIHLTFQEYLAAERLASQESGTVKQFLKERKYEPRYGTTLAFLAGIVNREDGSRQKQKLIDLFNMLAEEPKDIVGVRHNLLLMGCLDQCPDEEGLYDRLNDATGVLDRLYAWIDMGFREAYHEVQQTFQRYPDTYQSFFATRRLLGVLAAIARDKSVTAFGVKSNVARAVGSIGQADEEAVGALVAGLRDESGGVLSMFSMGKDCAAEALGKIGLAERRVIEALLASVRNETARLDDRRSAARALGRIGRVDQLAVRALVPVVNDSRVNGWVRAAVAEALAGVGSAGEEANRALVDVLRDEAEDENVRRASAEALGNIGRADEEVVRLLVALLRDETADDRGRGLAAASLGRIGEADREVVKALVAVLRDEKGDTHAGWWASEALGDIGDVGEEATRLLVALLRGERAGCRWPSADALGKIAQEDTQVTRTLGGVVRDESVDVWGRISAAEQLTRIGYVDGEVSGTLIAVLGDRAVDGPYRRQAIRILGNGGQADERVVEALVSVYTDETEDGSLRGAALDAMVEMGRAGDRAIMKTLVGVLGDEAVRAAVRNSAADALGNIGLADAEVIRALATVLADEGARTGLKEFAAMALGKIGRADEEVRRLLAGIVRDGTGDCTLRGYAADALGDIGQADEETIRTLLSSAIEDETVDRPVGGNCIEALGKLDLSACMGDIRLADFQYADDGYDVLGATPLSAIARQCLRLGCPAEWLEIVAGRAVRSASALWVDAKNRTVSVVEDSGAWSLAIPDSVATEDLDSAIGEAVARTGLRAPGECVATAQGHGGRWTDLAALRPIVGK